MTNEAKTGVMVLICVLALLGLILKVGNFALLQKGYTVKSHLHYTAGVKKHAPVRLSGVDVGEVRQINVLYGDETIVELVLWLEDGVKIRLDSTAYVTTLGLMGEKYIEIKAGTQTADYAKEGDIIASEDPVRLEEIMKTVTGVAKDVGKMANDISKVAQSVDKTVTENRTQIDQIVYNLKDTSENFKDFSQDIKFHPWKILAKGKEKTKEEMDRETVRQRQKQLEKSAAMESTTGPATAMKSNFSPKK
jgi:phospholipid/cholesterol/gamma-HCH transport system substrate-binding protein